MNSDNPHTPEQILADARAHYKSDPDAPFSEVVKPIKFKIEAPDEAWHKRKVEAAKDEPAT